MDDYFRYVMTEDGLMKEYVDVIEVNGFTVRKVMRVKLANLSEVEQVLEQVMSTGQVAVPKTDRNGKEGFVLFTRGTNDGQWLTISKKD